MAVPLRRRGEGGKGPNIKKKTFLNFFFATAIKLEGGGGLCLNGTAIKKDFFCRFL